MQLLKTSQKKENEAYNNKILLHRQTGDLHYSNPEENVLNCQAKLTE